MNTERLFCQGIRLVRSATHGGRTMVLTARDVLRGARAPAAPASGSQCAALLAAEPPGWWPAAPAGSLLDAVEKVVPFIGAGVSIAAGLPSAKQLAAQLRARSIPSTARFDNPNDPRHVASALISAGAGQASVQREVADTFELGRNPDWHLTSTLCALAGTPSRWVLTLNYDLTVEAAAQEQGIPFDTVLPRDLASRTRWLRRGERPAHLQIVHLHGAVTDPKTIVLDGETYASAAEDRVVAEFLAALHARTAMCFFGLTLDEAYVLLRFELQRPTAPAHVFVAPRETVEAVTQGRLALDRLRHGIETVELPGGDWSRLPGFAVRLLRRPATILSPHPSAPAAASASLGQTRAGHVPLTIVPVEADTGDYRLQVTLGLPEDVAVSEQDLVAERRALVTGDAGSGKSTLLRRLGAVMPADEHPVLVHLRPGLVVDDADAPNMLVVWAAAGEGLRSAESVGVDALSARSFHFLLDGVDEMPLEEQRGFVSALGRIADGFPQHRYTMASRATAALEQLGPTWRRFSVLPTFEWAEEFLLRNELSWDKLQAACPFVVELRGELLYLPFYLSALVTMHETGRLAVVRDAWALVQTLVDIALNTDEIRELGEDDARTWLRRFALWLALSERTVAPLDDAYALRLPGERTTADVLVDKLVHRSLLSYGGGGVAWVHRLVGEGLIAEALNELGNEDREAVLAVISPRESALVRGTRDFWRQPLDYICGRDADWRSALRNRDELAAARRASR
jgi:energy-coupling factor transporter ATP-binding protein EcfA2